MKALPLLLCSVQLCGCQDREARAQNAALQARVTELEAQVRAMQGEQATALPADAQSVTERAAGQNCANALTRTLEVFRDRKSTRLNSSHVSESRMPSSA